MGVVAPISLNLDKLIHHTEERWLNPLIESCRVSFSECHLPSHDEAHHLRVWKYAKMVLHQLANQNTAISETDIERLIIAVFFHDQGMSKTLSKEHGKLSRQICKSYFAQSALPPPSRFEEVLQAIEEHDKKDYPTLTHHRGGFDVQKILNIADDLDALGYVGAYRYSEIYLLRDLQVPLLPGLILENLGNRFQHFTAAFACIPSFIKAQNQRYMVTRNFFKDLNLQLKQVEYNENLYVGPIGVINYFRNEVVAKKKRIGDVCNLAISANHDFYSKHFFERLTKELCE